MHNENLYKFFFINKVNITNELLNSIKNKELVYKLTCEYCYLEILK